MPLTLEEVKEAAVSSMQDSKDALGPATCAYAQALAMESELEAYLATDNDLNVELALRSLQQSRAYLGRYLSLQ